EESVEQIEVAGLNTGPTRAGILPKELTGDLEARQRGLCVRSLRRSQDDDGCGEKNQGARHPNATRCDRLSLHRALIRQDLSGGDLSVELHRAVAVRAKFDAAVPRLNAKRLRLRRKFTDCSPVLTIDEHLGCVR